MRRPSLRLVARTDCGLNHALSKTICRVLSDTSDSAPPMTPPIADGVLGVRDHQHVRIERSLLAVERLHRFARPRSSHDDGRPGEPGEIEGVHRLPELEQHVVGDVDDVADRAECRTPSAAPASSQGMAPMVTSAIAPT